MSLDDWMTLWAAAAITWHALAARRERAVILMRVAELAERLARGSLLQAITADAVARNESKIETVQTTLADQSALALPAQRPKE